MARYYTVAIDYHSGTAGSSTRRPRTAVPLVDVIADCATTGQGAFAAAYKTVRSTATLLVRCPSSACQGEDGPVFEDQNGDYLFTSSICRAAVHSGAITDGAGSVVELTLSAGATLDGRTWTIGRPQALELPARWVIRV